MSQNIVLLIMAAGFGKRYGSLKQLDSIGKNGEKLFEYSLRYASTVGINKVVFVIIKENLAEFQKINQKYHHQFDIEYVFQEIGILPKKYLLDANCMRNKPWGTAHAVLVAKEKIEGPFIVINADDYYALDGFFKLVAFFRNNPSDIKSESVLIAYRLKNTLFENSTVSRAICKLDTKNYLMQLHETANIVKKNNQIVSHLPHTILFSGEEWTSLNFWGFHHGIFDLLEKYFHQFLEKYEIDSNQEYYLTDAINEMIHFDQQKIKVIFSDEMWFGLTHYDDRSIVQEKILKYL